MEALECGPVALAIVLAHYGRWVSIEELRSACGVSRNGSRASNIVRAARTYGLEAQGFKAEPEVLRQTRPPAVLHWNFSHFVVFEGFDGRKRARINDPASGRRRITLSELDQSMTGVVLTFEPGPSFERKGQRPRLLRALRGRLLAAPQALVFVLLVSLLLLGPGLLTPAFARLFIDHVIQGGEAAWVRPLLAAMAANLVLLAVLVWIQRSFLLRFETRLAVDGSTHLFWHLLRLPLEFFNQRFPGDISSRVALNDRVAKLVAGDLAISTLSFVMLAFFACVMVQYDALLTGVSILAIGFNVVLLRWASRQRADGNKRLIREESHLHGVAIWGLEMIESLKATSTEGELFARWAGQQAKVVNLRQELEVANQPLETLPALLTAVNAALILGIGGMRVMDGRLSIGGLVAFQILAMAFTGPANRLVSLGRRLQLAEGEVGLLDDVLRAPALELDRPSVAQTPRARAPVKLTGHLELRGVTFGYGPLDPPVIKGVNLVLQPGACVALVGRTGSGKSTLAKLVSGLYEPWQGEILFDGHTRAELDRAVWMGSVAVVDQDIFVFEGTVKENLRLWNDALPMDRVLAGARDACILDEIEARPEGFDAWVADGGANWSGGQLQRLEIARALSGDPVLLILDEASSALDPEADARITESIRRRGCTCLLIAHRLSTIRNADEIIVFEDGEIIQRGNHEELMRSAGPYAQLVVNE